MKFFLKAADKHAKNAHGRRGVDQPVLFHRRRPWLQRGRRSRQDEHHYLLNMMVSTRVYLRATTSGIRTVLDSLVKENPKAKNADSSILKSLEGSGLIGVCTIKYCR